jgi:hypothetical protein
VNSIADHVRQILILLGENPNRPGLQNTPRRVEKSLIEMTTGITATDQKVESLLTLFPEDHCDEMVLVKDIEFTSMCEHHLLPFHGVAHVAYLPQHKRGVVGLSKLARLVDVFAARLQVQERLTMTGDRRTGRTRHRARVGVCHPSRAYVHGVSWCEKVGIVYHHIIVDGGVSRAGRSRRTASVDWQRLGSRFKPCPSPFDDERRDCPIPSRSSLRSERSR